MGTFQLRGAEKEECPPAHFTLGHIMGTMPGLYMFICVSLDRFMSMQYRYNNGRWSLESLKVSSLDPNEGHD